MLDVCFVVSHISHEHRHTPSCTAFFFSGVVRYLPDGSVSMVVKVPVRYTTCAAFGGEDRLLIIQIHPVLSLIMSLPMTLPSAWHNEGSRIDVPLASCLAGVLAKLHRCCVELGGRLAQCLSHSFPYGNVH